MTREREECYTYKVRHTISREIFWALTCLSIDFPCPEWVGWGWRVFHEALSCKSIIFLCCCNCGTGKWRLSLFNYGWSLAIELDNRGNLDCSGKWGNPTLGCTSLYSKGILGIEVPNANQERVLNFSTPTKSVAFGSAAFILYFSFVPFGPDP